MPTIPAPLTTNYPVWFTVLIVEDDEAVRTMIVAFLMNLGVKNLLIAKNAVEAKDAFKRIVIHLIISDHDLGPDAEGLTQENGEMILGMVKKEHPHTARLLVSGNPLNFEKTEHPHLGKPFTLQSLSPVVQDAFEKADA